MKKHVSINFRPGDESSLETIHNLVSLIEAHDAGIMLPDYDLARQNELKKYIAPQQDFTQKADLVVAIGGDGTFLRTAQMFIKTGQPIFGINRGTLGFLTEFNPGECKKFFPLALTNKLETGYRSFFEAVHIHGGKESGSLFFLNDAVLSKGSFSRAISLRLEINGRFLNHYSGDGLIISTPTGSTAYSLSAGGPIISPQISNAYLFTPVCPHALSIRPMLIPAESILKARVETELKNLLLTIDGQEAIHIEGNDEVLFRLSKYRVNLVHHPEKNYYDILREKLNWGQ